MNFSRLWRGGGGGDPFWWLPLISLGMVIVLCVVGRIFGGK